MSEQQNNDFDFKDVVLSPDDSIDSILKKIADATAPAHGRSLNNLQMLASEENSEKSRVEKSKDNKKNETLNDKASSENSIKEDSDKVILPEVDSISESADKQEIIVSEFAETTEKNDPSEPEADSLQFVFSDESDENISNNSTAQSVKNKGRLANFIDYIKHMVRSEGITELGTILSKILFTLYELTVQFFIWFKRVSRYILLPIAAGMVIFVIVLFTECKLAVKVAIDEDVIGYVNNSDEYYNAQTKAETNISIKTGEEYRVDTIPKYSMAIVPRSEVIEGEELVTTIQNYTEEVLGRNFGLFVDGNLVGTCRKKTAITDMLDSIMSPYSTGDVNETVGFMQDVQIIEGDYEDSYAMSISEMKKKLLKSTVVSQYQLTAEDTYQSLLLKFNIDEETFALLNPTVDVEALKEGDMINITEEKALVSVMVERVVAYENSIPYETEISYDPDVWSTIKTVVTPGVEGVSSVVANLVCINGIETEREIVSEVVTKEPVTELVIQGTKPITASGNFIWPLNDGDYFLITDRYYEWRTDHNHAALDIAGFYGTPILVCDSGQVVEAGWGDSYGYYILVQHTDICSTRYAHLSAIEVNVGDEVYQGQEIGLMGSTGYSTGTHLHLEVIVNGERCNPEEYIQIPGE